MILTSWDYILSSKDFMPSWIKGFELFLKRDSSVFFIRTQSTSKGSLIIECAPPGISLIGDEMVCWSKLRDLMEIFGLVWFSGWRRVRFESFWQVSQSSRGNVTIWGYFKDPTYGFPTRHKIGSCNLSNPWKGILANHM